jgi:hypothetical protein
MYVKQSMWSKLLKIQNQVSSRKCFIHSTILTFKSIIPTSLTTSFQVRMETKAKRKSLIITIWFQQFKYFQVILERFLYRQVHHSSQLHLALYLISNSTSFACSVFYYNKNSQWNNTHFLALQHFFMDSVRENWLKSHVTYKRRMDSKNGYQNKL